MQLLLTSNSGLESIIKKEIIDLGYNITKVLDRLIYFEGDKEAVARVNLWSRAGNKLYLLVGKTKVQNFDELFEAIYAIDRKQYIAPNQHYITLANSIKSKLFSTPTIQGITKKSIAKKLLGGKDGIWEEDIRENPIEIQVTLDRDIAHILINTTGRSLHQRGYRNNPYEGSIKENIAAGIISLAQWNDTTPFYDFFCGSGTFAIEAALKAKNIAPGLLRRFNFEDFYWFDKSILKKAKQECKDKINTNKIATIEGYDINDEAVGLAREHAESAQVDKYINFKKIDFFDLDLSNYSNATFIGNPPYGLRLKEENLFGLYQKIAEFFENGNNNTGGIITAYNEFYSIIKPKLRKQRKLYNGGEKCHFYRYLGER